MTVVERREATWAQAQRIVSLAEAHEVLPRLMPRKGAAVADVKRFHEKSAEVYRRVAEMDRGHHHEALYWAEREAQKARELGGQ
ncbi:AMED_5909 family protein [Lentzea roselyniae]|uniref:AMED_5909 family protein n=1 Tax=Lentzea roselyniae TaxID=531940 RepID=A0ABP7BYB3_9PSEU